MGIKNEGLLKELDNKALEITRYGEVYKNLFSEILNCLTLKPILNLK